MAKDKQPEQAEKDPLSLFIKKSQTWVEKYFKYALGLVVIGVLSFGLSMLYLYWQKNNNHKAEENLYQIKKQLMAEDLK